MIENEIYCNVTDFLKWNISKKTSCIVENNKFLGKISIFNSRNKRKSLQGYSLGIIGERRSQRKRERL